jgi:NAD-dependent deacetylase
MVRLATAGAQCGPALHQTGCYAANVIRIGKEDRLFVLTGAGVSAESGLPTFRGMNGLWRTFRVEELASPEAWRRDPALVWEFYSWRREVHRGVRPNPAHAALAELETRLGERMFLCTQNVDRLHEEGGSTRVVHMHGELFKSRCDGCDAPPFPDEREYKSLEQIARCACGGKIRPHIVWFGEQPFFLEEIAAALRACTVFVCVGSSGVVYPAAGFVQMIRGRAAVRTFYVGPEEPANLSAFDECFFGKAGELLPELFRAV